MTEQDCIKETRHWIETVIIDNNFCPFAQRELKRGRVHFHVNHDTNTEDVLFDLIQECRRLDEAPAIETSLIIYPDQFRDWNDFLDLIDISQQLLVEQGYEGIYQLASFHPDYCFEDAPADDPANYTNRSPYPMLHLLREDSLEQALDNYPDPEQIPENNIIKARAMGLSKMQKLLRDCYIDKKSHGDIK